MPAPLRHAGYVLLPLGGGLVCPSLGITDPMPETAIRREINRRIGSGESVQSPESVTWDSSIVSGSGSAAVVHVGAAAAVIGLGRHEPVRITITRIN